MLIPVLPTMQNTLGISKFQASLVITLFSVPAGIIIPLSGVLSDRYGRKVVIIPALLLYAVGGVVAGAAASFMSKPYTVIMVGRVLQGIGASGTAPIAMALAGDIYKGAARSKALGLLEATNGLGKVLSPILGVLVAFIAWFAAFWAFPLICVPTAFAVWYFIKEPKKHKASQNMSSYFKTVKNIFKRDWVWLTSAYYAGSIVLFNLFGVLFYISQILEDKYNIDGLPKGGILAVPLLAMAITSYTTGALIKKQLRLMKSLIVIGLLTVMGSLVLAAFFTSPYILLGLLVFTGIGTGLVLPCLNTLITSAVSKEERGIVTSLYGSVRFLGVAFGPPIFGWLMEMSSWIMFVSISVLAAIGAVLTIFFIKPPSSDSNNHPPTYRTEPMEYENLRRSLARKRARS